MIHFAQPIWLVAGLLTCTLVVWFLFSSARKRQATLERFAAHQLIGHLTRNISTTRRRYKNILLVVAVFCCFVALARPQYGANWVEVQRKGIDLLFALDTSKSMLAEDIKPNRLKRAHLAILDFVGKLDGDRVGLLPFAGSAYLMCPLTLDYDAFAESLASVDTSIIPQGGTNIAAVINKAVDTLSSGVNHKILIILTDGENLQGDAIMAAEKAVEQGLIIHTVGTGTSRGELIPLPGGGGQGFVKDSSGNFVSSKLDESTLKKISGKSGGLYVPLGTAGEGLETIYREKLALIPKDNLAERRHKVPVERFIWPLGLAIILLVLEFLIGERKGTLPFFKTVRNFRNKSVFTGLLLTLVMLPITTRSYAQAGEEAYSQGKYLQASEFYREKLAQTPEDPVLNYNFGTAAYKNNIFDDAIEAFGKALKSDDIELQQKAYYNRGNSYYQKGVELAQGDPQKTAALWEDAIASFDAALALDPDNENTRHNHEIVQKQLDELKKQLEQQEKEKKQNEEGKQQGNNDKDNNTQDNGDQQQNSTNGGGGEKQSDEAGSTSENPADNSGDLQQPATPSAVPQENDTPSSETGEPGKQASEEGNEKNEIQNVTAGKMTPDEARQLLNALKNEEGELNFIPRGSRNQKIDRDW